MDRGEGGRGEGRGEQMSRDEVAKEWMKSG